MKGDYCIPQPTRDVVSTAIVKSVPYPCYDAYYDDGSYRHPTFFVFNITVMTVSVLIAVVTSARYNLPMFVTIVIIVALILAMNNN